MSNSGGSAEKRSGAWGKVLNVFRRIGKILGGIGTWIFRLRKIFLSIPVLYLAISLALNNLRELPEQVGMNLQPSGEYAMMVTRELAVFGPLGITAACLLLMLCSRRALYPWVISLFTLVIPVMILVMNTYPA